jgi:glutaredoxin
LATKTKIVLYTHPDCSFSAALKEELDAAGADYEEIDLARQPDKWADLEALTGGERITPVMIEGDVVSVGFHGVG